MMMESIQTMFHLFEGIHIFKANKIIIEKLKEQKKLLASGELVHSIPSFLAFKSTFGSSELHHNGLFQWKVMV